MNFSQILLSIINDVKCIGVKSVKPDKDIYGDDSPDAFDDNSYDAHSSHYFERKDVDPCDDYWDELAGQ